MAANALMPRYWLDRRVLVTGATGLLGSAVVRRLLELRADVVTLVRDWVPNSEAVRADLLARTTVVRGDVRSRTTLERALAEYEIDTVLHLAAQTIVGVALDNPAATFDTNVRGTWQLLEACRRSPRVKSIVVASSDKAYGASPTLPYSEDAPLRGTAPYDVSKSAADLIAQSYALTYDLPVSVTRCGNFFGGGDLNWSRLVPGTIRSILRDQPPVIRSDGTLVRDYFYIEDGAHAALLLAEQLSQRSDLRGRAFNFSNEAQLTALQLVEKITTLMGSRLVPDIRNQAKHEIPRQFLSAERARRELGWAPLFDLDTGLRRTIDWYRAALA
jgi:CDP-glucose 4,6-dehydratase